MQTEAGRENLDHLVPAVYDELRRLARGILRGERAAHTLQPTALVHEAYLRLAASKALDLRQRQQFLALAAQVMRRVLVDYARARRSKKRGLEPIMVTLSDGLGTAQQPEFDLLALDQALARLEAIDGRQVRIVELRYLAGLSVEEAAEVLGASPAVVKRETAMAKAWLFRELTTWSHG